MAIRYFQLKPPIVTGDQFQQSKPPWPAGVDTCAEGASPGVPHLHVTGPPGMVITLPVGELDWVVVDATGGQSVLTDAAFTAKYAPASPV